MGISFQNQISKMFFQAMKNIRNQIQLNLSNFLGFPGDIGHRGGGRSCPKLPQVLVATVKRTAKAGAVTSRDEER